MLLHICLLSAFCIDNYNSFYLICDKHKYITQKQIAFILSLKSSIILFVFSLFFNYKLFKYNYDVNLYVQNLSSEVDLFAQLVITFFTAYLVTDIIIGYFYYHQYMLPISGYLHHFIYIMLNALSFYINLYPIYILFLSEELPTILLSLGSYNEIYRNDMIFGTTFFLTRILYHMFLSYVFRKSYIILFFSILVLPVHLFWFKGWVNKYLLKFIKQKIN